MDQLDLLNKEHGFRKSLTMSADYAALEALLAGDKNIWRERISDWHLVVLPYGLATLPDPRTVRKRESAERQARESAEASR